MRKFLVLIVVFGLVVVAGCSKKEENIEKVREKDGVVFNEPTQSTFMGEAQANSQPKLLAGETGSSPKWGSGWIDLATAMDFAAGDKLRIRIGGTAKKVLVRLLPEGSFPDSTDGIVGGAFIVPGNRVVEVVLDKDRKGIIQISVHGGPNPWGKFPLGGGNGPATIESVTLIR